MTSRKLFTKYVDGVLLQVETPDYDESSLQVNSTPKHLSPQSISKHIEQERRSLPADSYVDSRLDVNNRAQKVKSSVGH